MPSLSARAPELVAPQLLLGSVFLAAGGIIAVYMNGSMEQHVVKYLAK